MRGSIKQDGLLALFVLFLIVGPAISSAQQPRYMVPGFNDPQSVVRDRMAHLPADLKLTSGQRTRLRATFLKFAIAERHVIASPIPPLQLRIKLTRLSQEADGEIGKFLTPKQMRILRRRTPARVQSSSRFTKGTP